MSSRPTGPATGLWVLGARRDQVPPGEAWLSARERTVLAGLRFERRRADWLLGRWAAKRAVAAWLRLGGGEPPELHGVEILAATDGAPEVFVHGEPGPSLSLSHRQGEALVAVADPATLVGCDLEWIEARSDAFVADYLTPSEQALVAAVPESRDLAANLLWSAKEATLKLLRQGLRRDPRWVEARPELPAPGSSHGAWRSLETATDGSPTATYLGWWLRTGNRVSTVIADPRHSAPRELSSRP